MATNEQLNEVIGDLAGRTGNNRPLRDALVDEATAEEHPLHGEFIWDNEVAGHQFRLGQADKLIKLARIDVTDPLTRRTVRVPAFIRNPVEPPGTFISTPRLRDERDVAIEVVRKEFERIHAAMKRAEKVASTIPDMQPLVAIERERIAALMRRFESS